MLSKLNENGQPKPPYGEGCQLQKKQLRIKYNSRFIRHGTKAGTAQRFPASETVFGQSYADYDKIV